MIEIDGSMGEGGGQILRSALAFSALLGIPVRVFNIRANRRPPGLKPGHLTAVKALAEISDARVEGLRIRSKELTFIPGKIRSGSFEFNVGTAGSVSLILQALMPVMAFAPGEIRLRLIGGTAVPMSPTIHYFQRVFLEALSRMGLSATLSIRRMGYYPRGGGVVDVVVNPVDRLEPIILERTENDPKAVVFISNLPDRIARDMAHEAEEIGAEVEILRYRALDKGCGMVIYSISKKGIVGADQLCKKGVHATKIGRMAVDKYLQEIPHGADRHLADHLIIRSSVADGESVIDTSEITSHAKTQIDLVKIFLPEVDLKVSGNKISIKGIGLRRSDRLRKV